MLLDAWSLLRRAAFVVCLLAIAPATVLCQARDSLNLRRQLRQLHAQNAYIRIQARRLGAEGRIGELSSAQVVIRGQQLAVPEIQSIERRVAVGQTGFRRGFRMGAIGGLVLSIPLRLFAEYLNESTCTVPCSIGLHAVFPAAVGLAGGMVGDLARPNTYGWSRVWP